jgi:hypothetical protein
MHITGGYQSQFEFFPHAPGQAPTEGKSPYQLKSLTLTAENIIVLGIVFVMTLVLFFSFGFEKGKRVTRISLWEAFKSAAPVAAVQAQAERVVLPAREASVPEERGENLGAGQDPLPEILPSRTGAEEDIFTIQVASFKQERDAQKEATLLKKKGYDIFVLLKGKHSIVCVGKFAQKNAAKQFSNRLKNKYTDCLVRRL